MSICKAPCQVPTSHQDCAAMDQWPRLSFWSRFWPDPTWLDLTWPDLTWPDPTDLARPGHQTVAWPVTDPISPMLPNAVNHPVWPLRHMVTVVGHTGCTSCQKSINYTPCQKSINYTPCQKSINYTPFQKHADQHDMLSWKQVSLGPQKWRIISLQWKIQIVLKGSAYA